MPIKETEYFDNITEKVSEAIWGILPSKPLHLSVKPIAINPSYLSGMASLKQMMMEIDFGDATEEIPITVVLPNKTFPCPAIIKINDENTLESSSIEEMVNEGCAVFSVYFKDITDNNSNFKSGLYPRIAGSRRKKTSSGKAIVWAWAAIRILEYASVLSEIDNTKIGITGKGIFAFSARLAANADSRFSFIIPCDEPQINDDFISEYPYLFSRSFTV